MCFIASNSFLALPSRAQDAQPDSPSVAEAARQEKSRKEAQQKKDSHVYTNEDLKQSQILTQQDRSRIEAHKNNSPATPATPAEPAVNAEKHTAEVLSELDEGTIRLTLFQSDGPTLGVDRFVRARAAGGAPLTPAAPLHGTYRAVVRDAQGAPVGWLRVRIDPPEPRVYDGVLPAEIGDPLAAAAVVALDGEVAWIEEHGSGGR